MTLTDNPLKVGIKKVTKGPETKLVKIADLELIGEQKLSLNILEQVVLKGEVGKRDGIYGI